MYNALQEVESCVMGYTENFDQKSNLHIIARRQRVKQARNDIDNVTIW